jgi:glucose-6-phosphate isomerase
VEARLQSLAAQDIVPRIWNRDHTVWKPDPAEIADRLGWLSVHQEMRAEVPRLTAFAKEAAASGMTTAVLLGMGGSSLAPEVLHATLGSALRYLRLEVLDTTDPAQIASVEASLDLDATLFIVASKSGTTIETLSQFAYFWEKLSKGGNYVAVTDPGSGLETLARERGFRDIFLNPPDIGGRYSALSFYGLVPAALMGVDLDRLLTAAVEEARLCGVTLPPVENPGATLGAIMAEAVLAGRDKLTLVLPPEIATLGYWIEQLVAESTGKEDLGILPVEGETLGSPTVYGNDRLFVAIGDHSGLDSLAAAGHPVVQLPFGGSGQLAAEFFRWEFATAVASHILRINPFDQPNVQEAKDRTARILAGAEVDPATPSLASVLEQVGPGDYIAITAYVPRNASTQRSLHQLRMRLRDRYHVATTVGFGPRFLHSTGQLHKGGPNTGVFIQVITDDPADLPIPGRPYTFGRLKQAQALGDLASLRDHNRRVARVTLPELEAALT